jgi:hypothetical protein
MSGGAELVHVVLGDGNAFAILGACRRAARRAGWSDDEWSAFQDEATRDDYDHLLLTVMGRFDVELDY